MYLNFGVKFVGVVRNVICLTSFVCFMIKGGMRDAP